MSATTVLLIRHAAHDDVDRTLCGRRAGVSLGIAGRGQAARLAARLAATLEPDAIEAIYSSPLERTRETAEALTATTGRDVRVDADLTELDFGAWTGRAFDDLATDETWRLWNRLRLHSRPPGGESLQEAQVRIVRFILRVGERHPAGVVAAVSHADVIKSALCWALGLSLEHYARFEVSPASVSRVIVGDWGTKVWSLNDVPA